MNPFLDIAAARKALPYLHDQLDDYLRSQSYGDLVRANVTLAKADQNSALTALDKRMAANFRELKTKPIRIEAGWDRPAHSTSYGRRPGKLFWRPATGLLRAMTWRALGSELMHQQKAWLKCIFRDRPTSPSSTSWRPT